MIITLVRANFSANNIGTLDSFAVLTNLGSGLIYSGPNSVIKNAALDATITLGDNYTLDNISILMGGVALSNAHTVNGNTISINIASVTGIVTIVATTVGDTSLPAEVWYITTLSQLAESGEDLTTATDMTCATKYVPWAFDSNINSKVVGKTINAVEIVPRKAGQFSVGKVNSSTFAYSTMGTFTIDAADIGNRTIYTFPAYTIEENEYFTFNADGDSGMTGYFLKADVDPLAVECVTKMNSGCDDGSFTDFNHQLAVVINVGYVANADSGDNNDVPSVDDNTSSGDNGDSTNTPSVPETDGNTTWYIASLKQLQDSGNDLSKKVKLQSGGSSYSWAFQESMNDKLVGKTINTLEMIPQSTGDFYVGKYDTSTNTVTEKRKVTISEVDTPVTLRFDDLTINEGEFFVWNCLGASGEAIGYYIMKANVDPLAVETSGWYQAKSTGLAPFSNYELAYIANIGYTAE